MGYFFGADSCHCDTCVCACENFTATTWSNSTASYGQFLPCLRCAYFDVTYPDPGFPEFINTVPVPVGMTYTGEGGFDWGQVISTPGVAFESFCRNSNYIEWLNDGEPTIEAEPTHPYWTATTISLVTKVWVSGEDSTTDYYLVEVFLNSNCEASSLATKAVGATTITSATLSTTPRIVENFFSGGIDDGDPADTLYLCSDPPNGACCSGDDPPSVELNIEALPCKFFFMVRGTWYEDGTYDPEDPCSGDPFP